MSDEGIRLVKETKRLGQKLGEYNEESVRNVIMETRNLAEDMNEIVTALRNKLSQSDDMDTDLSVYSSYTPESLKPAALIHHHTQLRNKRCLFAYHKNRRDKMTKLAWQVGPILPETVRQSLHPSEQEFMDGYQQLIQWYRGQFLDIDIGSDVALIPPKDLFVEVRVLKDCGEIMTENGPVRLAANSQHYLRRSDIEAFIPQGYIKHIE